VILLLLFLLSCLGSLRMKPAPWLRVFLEYLSSIGRCMTYVYKTRHAVPAQHSHKCRSGLSMSDLIANMKPGKPWLDLAETCCDSMVIIV
jgi:hypothetical protein